MTWEMKPLGEIGRWTGGGTPSKSRPDFWDGDIPWLSPKDMGHSTLTGTKDHISLTAVQESSTKLIPAGSVAVVTRSGILEHTLPSALVPFEVTLNQDMKAFTPFDGIEAKWVLWGLRAHERQILEKCRKAGTTVASIEWRRFAQFELPVPTLAEQRRILDLVEEHLSHLDAADDALSAAASRLSAGTVSQRTSLMSQAGRRTSLLASLASVGTGTTPSRSNIAFYTGGTIPWITSGDISQGEISTPKHWVTQKALDETSLRMYPSGTLLVAMYGEGKTRGQVGRLTLPATINQACAAIQVHDPSQTDWIAAVLDCQYLSMRRLASGGVQPNLNLSIVKSLSIPMPDSETRARLLREKRHWDTSETRLASNLGMARMRSSALRRALLAAAFSGRLTGHSSDAELIEEIGATLTAQPTLPEE